MLFVFSLSVVLHFTISCSMPIQEAKLKYSAKVIFKQNDSVINLNNNFKVFIEGLSHSISTVIVNDSVSFEVPMSLKYENCKIAFQKGTVTISVNNVPGFFFTDKSPENLIFGTATAPYFKELGLVVPKDSATIKPIVAMNYFCIDPVIDGIGRIYKSYIR
jgi:hypothetical protein